MSDAAQFARTSPLAHGAALCALILLAGCGDSGTTDPKVDPVPVAPATGIGLLTPFDSAAPLIRLSNDSQPSALSVQLRDAAGQSVRQAGRTLTLTVLERDGSATTRVQIRRGGTATTDDAGVARVTSLVLAGRAGAALLSLRIDTLPAVTVPVRLDAGVVSASASAVSVSPDTMVVGGVSQVVVVPMDASGNKRGAGQQVSATLDGNAALATISPFTYNAADSSYRSSITANGPSTARAFRTTVNGTALSVTPPFTSIAAPPPPAAPAAALRITTLPGDTTASLQVQSGALWQSTTVQLVDAAGTAVRQAGVAVTARAVTTGGATLPNASLVGAGPVSTNVNGQAVFSALALTAPAGSARMRFEAGALTAASLPVRVLPGVASASRSTITTSRETLIVDSVATISVTPRDAAGSALGPAQTVTLAASGGSGVSTGTIGAVTYDATDSSYRATFTAAAAGTVTTIRATTNGTPVTATVGLTVIVAPGVPTAASPVSVSPDTIPVGGTAQFVTTPLDGAGRKIGPGLTVAASLSSGNGVSVATIGTITYTPGDSSYRASISGVTVGTTATVTTTVNGVTLAATRPLTVSAAAPPSPATTLVITTLPGDTTAGGLDVQSGALLNSVTVALRNASGGAVAQAGVAVSVTAVTSTGTAWAGATLTGAGPLSTGADGTITFPALRLTAPVGSGRLRFTATGLAAASFPVRVRAGAPSTSVSTFTLTSETIPVGGTSTAIVTLRDAGGNKIGSGQTVAFSLGTGTSGITVGPVTFTASDSTYRAALTGSTAGTARTVSASVGGVALAITRPLTVTAVVNAEITATVNGATTFPISRYIYGGNYLNSGAFGNANVPSEFTFYRMGGNRMSAYNWENNYSNAGADFNFQNDDLMDQTTVPGALFNTQAALAFPRGQALLATIPMIGYVAADNCRCNVGTSDADRANRLATRFRVSRAAKGSAFTLTPNPNDAFVYQDEFVNWVESNYPGRTTHPTAPVFYSLDNEPDIWHVTHKQISSDLNDNPSTPRLQTYQGFSDTSAVYARAVKAVAPNALIFGPATATYAGITLLGRYPTPDPVFGSQNFTDVYLDRMRTASQAAGRRLLDVFDVHYYPEMGTPNGTIINDYATQDAAMIEARVQAPRSLWDPTYTDNSWVPGAAGGPVRLIPRLRDQIAARYPGTKLAITEYYYGRGGDISGGIAQADVFGIFGREGVFAASIWPFAGLSASPWNGNGNLAYAYVFGALRVFRNYDGAGSSFGDTGLQATTSNVAQSSVYASRTSTGRTVLVVINKTTTPKVTQITLSGVGNPTTAQVYVMQDGSPNPSRQADVTISGNILTYTMPAMSVSTLALTP